jgi:hypothetical protein
LYFIFEPYNEKQIAMEYGLIGNRQATVTHRFNSKTAAESKPFKGIEVDLFSHTIIQEDFCDLISEVAGNHFDIVRQPGADKSYATFYIAPKDYALIEGGMMYTTAGRIITDLISKGLLIKGYWTVK